MKQDARQLFRELADSDDEYAEEGGFIYFTHQGREHAISLTHAAGIGPAVSKRDETVWIPVETFIQTDILELPILARQISRTFTKKHQQQGLKEFIDGAALQVGRDSSQSVPSAKQALKNLLEFPTYGCTQLIELMAPAGQGKTVLLEHLALESAVAFKPDPSPRPLLLVVDLLGRYVGTIHDAIAGSLSNTFQFPGLTGRDVEFCLRQRWLNLALDGFDELVARVGTREAFLRAKELVDDLQEAGTVILSARNTFFQLFEIDSGIRTYLQPRRGSYEIWEFDLEAWGQQQLRDVFAMLGSNNPDDDLHGLLGVFGSDSQIVYRPFFATRLAKAWIEGERFERLGSSGGVFDRWNYVIRIFLEREVSEKWVSRQEGFVELDLDGHIAMLGAVAEEMWRSGAFALTKDEVEIAGRLGLADLSLTPVQVDNLAARLPTHGVLSPALGSKGVKFLHDSFFHYLLGHRLGTSILKRDRDSVSAIVRKADVPPLVVLWASWCVKQKLQDYQEVLDWIIKEQSIWPDDHTTRVNIGNLLGAFASTYGSLQNLTIEKIQFTGEAPKAAVMRDVRFRNVGFTMADLSGTRFEGCQFEDCEFIDVKLDEQTSFLGSHIIGNSLFRGFEVARESGLFDPFEIIDLLRSRGADVPSQDLVTSAPRSRRRVTKEAVRCLDKFRRAKTWDICVDDMEERLGSVASDIARLGIASGIFRNSERDTSGKGKTFVRFVVNREELYEGQLGPTGDIKIDLFWDSVERVFPE